MSTPEARPATVRVLIADDQRVVRDGLVLLLGLLDGIEVVGAAGNGADAVRLAEQLRPDLVLMDLDMPVLDGAEATAMLRERVPGCAVLVLTTYADQRSIFPALRAGARGYLTKDADSDQVEAAIWNVHQGRMSLDPVVQEHLVAALAPASPPSATAAAAAAAAVASDASARAYPAPAAATSTAPIPTPPTVASGLPDGLTPREAEVLRLISDGLTNAEICDVLIISQATVKTHINRLFAKIGAHDRAQAVRYAFRHGLAHHE
jgi:DNA-binding NarL/FixJ family response regulator